jgi:signal transduction histidine kinase
MIVCLLEAIKAMPNLLRSFTQGPVRLQLAVLLFVTVVAANIFTAIIAQNTLLNGRPTLAADSVGSFRTLLNVISVLDQSQGDKAIRAAVAGDSQFQLLLAPPAISSNSANADADYEVALLEGIPEAFRTRVRAYSLQGGAAPGPLGSLGAAVQLDDGRWLVFEQSSNAWTIIPFVVIGLSATIFALPLFVLAFWLGSSLLKPIADLAEGAERFSTDLEAPPVPECGAREVRVAAAALNSMREKIKSLVERRSYALAAIGHDMRTPLTRMRLRADLIRDEDLSKAFLLEVDSIDRMITSALAFIRSEHQKTMMARVDIAILAQTVVDDFVDRGLLATYSGETRLTLQCDADLIRRLLENLCTNACRYAYGATVSVTTDGPAALVVVSDNGPGIPQDKHKLALEPFTKLDQARSSSGGSAGFGLGLATVKNIVDLHRGTIELSSTVPTGLTVQIRIPMDLPVAAETETGFPTHRPLIEQSA